MRKSRCKEKLKNGIPILVTTLHFSDPSVYEMASLLGFDALWLDLEHHHHSLETMSNLLRAARVGTSDVIVRPAKGEFMRMGRILEAGANGIMYPRCDNAEEAREVVRWAKFAPLGERGCDGANADNPYLMTPIPEYLKQANDETFIVIQLETPAAIERAEEIAAVEGVDVLMIGPGDLSVLSGIPGQMGHPIIQKAKEHVAAVTKKAGIQWGCPCGSIEQIREHIAMGSCFLPFSADFVLVKQGLEKILSDCSGMGFTFEKR